jgi:hypothetical protein
MERPRPAADDAVNPGRKLMTPTELAALYVSVWNEPDPARRRARIEQLWIPQGEHYVGTRRAIGYAELELRVQQSHAKNITERGYRFRPAGEVQPLHDAVMFQWEMFRPARPQVVEACGLQFLRLAPDGRIAVDYQFILPTAPAMTPEVMAATTSAP